jgi:hypothetical protein
MLLFSTCCAAMEALNLYEPWTYEEQVDVDAYTDPTELQAVLDQMAFMGQTPWQLLTSPHPQRHPIGGKFVLFKDTFYHLTTPAVYILRFLPI